MEESRQNERRKVRRERRIKKNERKLLKLQRKLHIKQLTTGEELPGRSGRRTSTDKGVDRNGNVIFRRSTTDAADHPSHVDLVGSRARLLQTGINYTADGSPVRQHPNPKKAEGAAIRGILSRLRMHPSQGKELDKIGLVPDKTGMAPDKIDPAPLKLSVSAPNFKSNDFVETQEGDEESSVASLL